MDDVLSDDELRAWLRLLGTPQLGRVGVRRLLAAFGAPEAVWAAPEAAWVGVVGQAAAASMREPPADLARQLDAVRAWRDAAPDRRVMVLGDADYPAALLNTADPPLLLYLRGDVGCLARPAVALVGSRQPTAQGRDHARAFGQALAARGWVVVSGLAAGIDGAAHEGALAAGEQGAGTVAVVGTGIDRVYPARHADLARRIVAEGGLVVSELPLGAPPLSQHFPQRNRIIAGLCQGTLVVEAALKSGSLITARLAAEAGREVMVLPGSVLAPQSAGGHELIRQGATLVVSVEQVLEALGTPLCLPAPTADDGAVTSGGDIDGDAPDTADPVLAVMGHDPVTLDALIARCGWPAHRLSAHLMTLELDGLVARLPGGLYQRRQGA